MTGRVHALTRKLLRDLWRIRSQVTAIAFVVGSGVSVYVLLLSAYASLELTQATYYERYRFADVFASVARAPLSLADDLAAIAGVAAVEARVVVDVTLDVAGRREPVSARLISLPEDRPPRVNDVFLASGRRLDPQSDEEVLASETFARENDLDPGDTIAALINGRRRVLRIVGLALSPEYIYAIRPGELIADNARFGVLWMNRRALASAYQMEGAFNDVSLALARGASPQAVIEAVDRRLEPYGGLGAIPRAQQMSHFFLQGELDQLAGMGRFLPIIFLTVAAFLINVVLTRLVAVEREQIAALKALGYANREIGWHYVKWGLAVAIAGTAIGLITGAWLGRGMTRLYTDFFNFPVLEYRLPPRVAVQAAAIAMFASVFGAAGAVARVVRLPPAEAMRPEAPARYRVSWIERIGFRRWLTPPWRMVVRTLQRHPARAGMSALAIAMSASLLIVGLFSLDSIEQVIDVQFSDAQRYDMLVAFVRPVSASARYDVARLPGVRLAEPFRTVPVRLRAGPRSRYLALQGIDRDSTLLRVIDGDGDVVAMPPDGLVLSRKLAEVLGAGTGDRVEVEVLEGERPSRDLTIVRLIDDYMGLNAYMDAGALHRLLREGPLVSGAYLRVDPRQVDVLYGTLTATPAVAGVALKQATVDNFEETLSETVGITRTITVIFAAIIAFGVVYNTARVALSERGRELATLRVIGLTRAEIARILFGEWAIVTAVALPLGMMLGYGLAALTVQAFSTDVYRLPLVVAPRTYLWSVATVASAAAVSALIVRRRLDHLDLIAVLKTRE